MVTITSTFRMTNVRAEVDPSVKTKASTLPSVETSAFPLEACNGKRPQETERLPQIGVRTK